MMVSSARPLEMEIQRSAATLAGAWGLARQVIARVTNRLASATGSSCILELVQMRSMAFPCSCLMLIRVPAGLRIRLSICTLLLSMTHPAAKVVLTKTVATARVRGSNMAGICL